MPSPDKAFSRPVPAPLLNFAVALWMLCLLNPSFWPALWDAVGGWDAERAGWLLTLPLLAVTWVWLCLELLTWQRIGKAVLCLLLPSAATLAYFAQKYGIVFDRGMLRNVLETDWSEAQELLSGGLVVWVLFLGVAPALIVARVPLLWRGWRPTLVCKGLTILLLAVASVLIVASSFASYASLFRNHRELRLQFVPLNMLAAAHSYARARFGLPPTLETVASDATRMPGVQQQGRPLVFVVAIGETARAANLSLNGYERPTTPMLGARTDLITFGAAQACGTATATSLPCMFLDVGREAYTDGMAYRRESLADALQRAGLDVWWIDNNSGCKGVCDRVRVVEAARLAADAECGPDGCHDEVLLDELSRRLDAITRDTVIVLHLKGQHGPAYYRRYPPTFERFTPACTTNQLDRCDRTSIVNAYDNALTYTDHVLDWAITTLAADVKRYDTALLFVSDHGESLGENGLYLHGLPYDLAPAPQKEVPFLAWLPEETVKRLMLDRSCLAQRSSGVSHDNLYHSVLGLTGVRAGVYRAEQDIFAACRSDRVSPSRLSPAGAESPPSTLNPRKESS